MSKQKNNADYSKDDHEREKYFQVAHLMPPFGDPGNSQRAETRLRLRRQARKQARKSQAPTDFQGQERLP